MHIQRQLKATRGLAISLAMFTSLSLTALAQEATIEGLVTGRSGSSMSVRTADSPKTTVLLSDSTKATEKGGFLGLDRKSLGITALVPGLSVKVEGAYNPDHQLVATKVTFSRSSMKTARQIEAGLNPVNDQVAAAQDQLRTDRKDLDQTQQDLAKNTQDIDATKQGLAATNEITTANTQGVGHANQRIGALDQYATKGSITVNFANGKATVTKKDRDQLTEFVKSAADTPGYMIEVQGYASTSGSAAMNQKLSAERADAVLAIIQQTGVVPMTRILAPAAMGTTNQVATEHSRSAQAQNRRVVVTIVVNQGITG
ncbi:OmpA family protein [Granulicella pectinivorans]|uniref:OmpA family protein n=1 Tax=Granulicella pectinivorans TaxID=474950 RepID=A0A1I6MTD2_9BACT|nr:OmpA family protein [Granulicella pectinivorans]SFS18982.1 OmpA family protein [Granulicella pectinivorans]